MYDVITIQINVQLPQDFDLLCGQIPICALRLINFVLDVLFGTWISYVHQLISLVPRVNTGKQIGGN